MSPETSDRHSITQLVEDVTLLNSSPASEASNAALDAQQTSAMIITQMEEKSQVIVDFEGDDDPANPINWSRKYKWTVIFLMSIINLIATLATLMCTPAAPQILADFKSDDQRYYTFLVSIWELGEGLGSVVIAPLSETYGRLPVWHVANVFLVVFTVACALSDSLQMLVAFRFLSGCSLVSVTLSPSIIGDIFAQEERGTPMAIAGIGTLIGPIAGPIMGSFLSQSKGWRWVFWTVAIFTGGYEIVCLLLLRESYRIRILDRKAKRLRQKTGNSSFRSKHDVGISGKDVFQQCVIRPIKIWIYSPIVLLLSIYMAVIYGYEYLVFTTITEVFETEYDFQARIVGLVFLGMGIGSIIGLILIGATSDWYIKKKAAKGEMRPEDRLPPMILGGLAMPAGLFLYGWTAEKHVHWTAPIVGTAMVEFGFIVTQIPIQTYIVDAFPLHAASALNVMTVLRSWAGAILPFAGPPLYARLGYGWGNSVLGFIALAFVPVPLLFIRYGERVRKSPRSERKLQNL